MLDAKDAVTSSSTLSWMRSVHQARDALRLSLDVAILNLMVFPLDVAEIAQSLAECFDSRPRIIGIASSRDDTQCAGFFPPAVGRQ